MQKYDAIVIGSGVAGMTAAIYLKRANLRVLLIEKNAPGGQINVTDEICNYPGFSNIKGPELASNFYHQVSELKIDMVIEEVLAIEENGNGKVVITNDNKYQTTKIIIATGRKPRSLGLFNEERLTGRGISWCAICDGPLYKDKTVAVIGGGNSAVEEGIYLSTLAKKVYVIHRSENLRADRSAIDILKDKKNVEFKLGYEVQKYIVDEKHKLIGIEVINSSTKNIENIELDGIFMFIGYQPIGNMFNNLGVVDENGYIIVDMNMRTKNKGIYACGDAIEKGVYQIATAVGEGAVAATSLINDLSTE